MSDKSAIEWTDATLAYLAGVIDADGFISIQRQEKKGRVYYGARVAITGTQPAPHELAATVFGGSVRSYVNRSPDNRRMFVWERYGEQAVRIIRALQPHLRVKAHQAALALQLQEHLIERPSLWPADLHGFLDDLVEEVRAANLRTRPVAAA